MPNEDELPSQKRYVNSSIYPPSYDLRSTAREASQVFQDKTFMERRTSGTTMDSLPQELLDAIVDHLDFTSLKTIRLVGRKLYAGATPLVFRDVHVAFFKHSFQRLAEIARADHLREHVETLTFHGELLPQYRSQAEWESRIDLRPKFSDFIRCVQQNYSDWDNASARRVAGQKYNNLPRHDKRSEELAIHCRLYEFYRSEQHGWDEVWAQKLFVDAVKSLPNLRDASCMWQSGWPLGERSDSGAVWQSMRSRLLQTPKDWKYPMVQDIWRHPRPGRHIAYMLQALGARNEAGYAGVRSLHLDSIDLPFWTEVSSTLEPCKLSPRGTRTAFGRKASLMSQAFTNLTSVYIHVTSVGQIHNSGVKWIATALAKAHDLEYMHIDFMSVEGSWSYHEPDEHSLLQQVNADETHWPRLSTLSLSLATTQEALLQFLERHRCSLRHLTIKDSYIHSGRGAWEGVIRKMPAITHLSSIYLEALGDADTDMASNRLLEFVPENSTYQQEVFDYCLHGGKFPILDVDEWLQKHPEYPGEELGGQGR